MARIRSRALDLFLFLATTGVAAFQAPKLIPTRQQQQQQQVQNPSLTKLFFHWDVDIDTSIETIDLAAMEKTVGTLLTTTTSISTASTTPELESEVLQDVSHLFLDFSVFVTKNQPILDVAQVIGRLLILAQDYLPDQHISPEELGIQVLMIATCLAKRGNETTN